MLTQEQDAFYRENGYVVVPGVLTREETDELRTVTDGFIDQSRGVSESDEIFDVEEGHSGDNPRLRRLKLPEQRHPAYAATLKNPRILSVLESLVGPNIHRQGVKLNLKPPRGGEPVEWHQDWAFFPHTNNDICVVGMMLDDVTEENGAMLVVPGSHKGPIYDHHQDGYFAGAVTDSRGPEVFAKAVALTGKAGDVQIHHARTLHASSQNLSDKYRRLLFITARAADCWPLGERPASFEEWQALMVQGEATIEPRMEVVPVRLPYPRRLSNKESIFDKQLGLRNSPFERTAAGSPPRTANAT